MHITKKLTEPAAERFRSPTRPCKSTALQNYGSVENKGIELGNQHRENFTGAFTLEYQFCVFSEPQQGAASAGDGVRILTFISGANIARVGQPLRGLFYGYKTNGLFQTGDDIANLPTTNPATTKPGDRRSMSTSNGDGKITQADDRTLIGKCPAEISVVALPTHCPYLNFDLSFFLPRHLRQQAFLTRTGSSSNCLPVSKNASVTAILDRWTPTNPTNVIQRAFEDPAPVNTSRYGEDASIPTPEKRDAGL